MFRNEERGRVVNVHGDDFTATGPKRQLEWFEATVREQYGLTTQPRLGPGDGDAKEATVLNRVVRWTKEGLEYEADPRQIERFISECGLDGSKSVTTPGVKASFTELEEDVVLPSQLHTAFRGAAAGATTWLLTASTVNSRAKKYAGV